MSDRLEQIGFQMIEQGLPAGFVLSIVALARQSEGVGDAVALWAEVPLEERDAVVAELHAMLEDRDPSGPPMRIESAGDAEEELERRRQLKARLRTLVERAGGVSKVAAAAGIPQPSLSRLLNTMSEPRPATLARLADAMGLPVEALRRAGSAHDLAGVRRERVRAEAIEAIGRQLQSRWAA